MICAWNELLKILPDCCRAAIDRRFRNQVQEIHLCRGSPPEIVTDTGVVWLSEEIKDSDLAQCINYASGYSPWAANGMSSGYISAPGGHRIGVCGEAVIKDGQFQGIGHVRSLCIRAARDFPGISRKIPLIDGSLLILGAPGWGKTTLLRDYARRLSDKKRVCVADERGEIFPSDFLPGKRMDVLTGAPKQAAIDLLLRTMNPGCIAVDEITAESDADALLCAFGCGVQLLATAHASSLADLRKRAVYRRILEAEVFSAYVILMPDRSYRMEGGNL